MDKRPSSSARSFFSMNLFFGVEVEKGAGGDPPPGDDARAAGARGGGRPHQPARPDRAPPWTCAAASSCRQRTAQQGRR